MKFTPKYRNRADSPIYESWRAMIARCTRPGHVGYADYGGRGITVCERWLSSFDAFCDDMGPRPPGRSLERVDHAGNYEPGNVRWASRAEQARNTRGNKLIEYGGRIACLAEWAETLGVKQDTLGTRLLRGLSVQEAFAAGDLRTSRYERARVRSTISRDVDDELSPTEEKRRSEGDDAMAEERAETERAWREGTF